MKPILKIGLYLSKYTATLVVIGLFDMNFYNLSHALLQIEDYILDYAHLKKKSNILLF